MKPEAPYTAGKPTRLSGLWINLTCCTSWQFLAGKKSGVPL